MVFLVELNSLAPESSSYGLVDRDCSPKGYVTFAAGHVEVNGLGRPRYLEFLVVKFSEMSVLELLGSFLYAPPH